MLQKCGPFDEMNIYYHPVTNKHLGFARIVFDNVKAAKSCIEKYNTKSVMGKILTVFHDAFGEECKKMFENLTNEKKIHTSQMNPVNAVLTLPAQIPPNIITPITIPSANVVNQPHLFMDENSKTDSDLQLYYGGADSKDSYSYKEKERVEYDYDYKDRSEYSKSHRFDDERDRPSRDKYYDGKSERHYHRV